MIIKLDCREIKLQQLCAAHAQAASEDITIVSESLPLGDIIICDNAGQEKVIIERKSLADLAASIRDGRYSEQSFRLNQCELHNHQIYYLIEGDLRYYRAYKGLPDKNALLSAMVSISYYKGFSLYRTNNLEETAEWLLRFAHKLQKEGPTALPYYVGGAAQTETVDYSQVMAKRVKKDNITPANIGEIMLAQIPGVSAVMASAILEKFSTLKALLKALEEDPNCLNSIKVVNKNGQQKKLAKPCINNIYEYLIKPSAIHIETTCAAVKTCEAVKTS